MPKIDRQSQTPLYAQLAAIIRGDIDAGVLGYGNRIPSENTLVREYAVSRVTVRNAIDMLAAENYVFRKQGKGTFVSLSAKPANRVVTSGFTAESFRDGAIPATRIVSKTILPAEACPPEGRAHFADAHLLRVASVRRLNNAPVIYEEDYFPMRFASLLDVRMDDRSLYSLLCAQFGICFSGYSYEFSVEMAASEYAKALGVRQCHPLLRVCQTLRDDEGRFVFFNVQRVRTELYKYRTENGC